MCRVSVACLRLELRYSLVLPTSTERQGEVESSANEKTLSSERKLTEHQRTTPSEHLSSLELCNSLLTRFFNQPFLTRRRENSCASCTNNNERRILHFQTMVQSVSSRYHVGRNLGQVCVRETLAYLMSLFHEHLATRFNKSFMRNDYNFTAERAKLRLRLELKTAQFVMTNYGVVVSFDGANRPDFQS